jgi:hypothetical protein
LKELNDNAIHDQLKYKSFLYFDEYGLPKGRPYSYLSNTLNPDKKHKSSSIEFRSDFFKRIGIPNYYQVYDIKSEFPRVNHLFHFGVWKDDDYDFYSEIVNDTRVNDRDDDILLQPRKTKYTEEIHTMKGNFMRIYFGKGTDLQSYGAYDKERRKGLRNSKIFNLSEAEYFDQMVESGELINFESWQKICNSTRKIVGPPIGNLIMWYSFFLEVEVIYTLMKKGKRVYNVYDGFYYERDIADEIKNLLTKKAVYIYKNYMKPVKLTK